MGPGDRVGRYRLLEPLGEGGMGVVFAAHDPDLDRKVALKLIGPRRRGRSVGAERLIREARSLAKLSHPNVVEIYDVGRWEGDVFIAMEQIDGRTLDEWVQGKATGEVLRVLAQAGEGLAEAHRAGIIHRDFKPANVLVDAAGLRARVLDFGLARGPGLSSSSPSEDSAENATEVVDALEEKLTAPGLVMGTPAYMAPEQHSGGTVDAKSDQYAFCIAAWEALYGQRPFLGTSHRDLMESKFHAEFRTPSGRGIPRRVEAALRRGLEPKAEERFATMDALLAALRGRRRGGTIALAVGVVAVGGVAAVVLAPRSATPCSDVAASVDDAWNAQRADAVEAAVLGTELPYAASTMSRLRSRLDAHAAEASRLRLESCTAAQVEGSISDAEFDRRMACLDRNLIEFDTLVGVLERATATDIQHAHASAARLGDQQRCTSPEDLESDWPEPQDPAQAIAVASVRRAIAKVDALLGAGRFEDAIPEAERAEAMAESVGFVATRVEVGLRLGRLAEAQGRYEDAAKRYEAAAHAASGGGFDRLALRAKSGLVAVHGHHLAQYEDAKRWARDARSHLQRLREPGIEEAMLLNNLGQAAARAGLHAEARTYHEQSLALREKLLPPDDPDVGTALLNLGNTLHGMEDYVGAQRYYRRVLPIWEQGLGAEHPDMAGLHNNLGSVALQLDKPEEARPHLERALAIWEAVHGGDHPEVAIALVNLADLEASEAKYRRAMGIFETALGADHPYVAVCANNLGRLLAEEKRYDDARSMLRRAVSILETAGGSDDDLDEARAELAKVTAAQKAARLP